MEVKYKVWQPSNIYPSAKIGEGSNIGMFVEIWRNVVIGKNCKIGFGAFIPEGVTIGDNVFIGPRVCFTNDKHPKAIGDWKISPTIVRDGASIGANATILPGICIGRNAMVGSGSVVTHSVDDDITVVGNPAKKIKYENR